MPQKLKKRLISFRFAFAGIKYVLTTQGNMIIHVAATLLVILAAILLHVDRGDWMMLVIAIGLVWMAEFFNTAIETTVDLVTAEQHPLAKIAKDVSAGAVLIAAMTSLVLGLIVFIPYLLHLFGAV